MFSNAPPALRFQGKSHLTEALTQSPLCSMGGHSHTSILGIPALTQYSS